MEFYFNCSCRSMLQLYLNKDYSIVCFFPVKRAAFSQNTSLRTRISNSFNSSPIFCGCLVKSSTCTQCINRKQKHRLSLSKCSFKTGPKLDWIPAFRKTERIYNRQKIAFLCFAKFHRFYNRHHTF